MKETILLTLQQSPSLAGARLRDYVELLKPRVMSLVVFSGGVGLAVAPGSLHPLLAATAIFCIALAAGGSAAVNMWYDRDIDALMTRTRRRPLPQGRVTPEAALELGGVLILTAVLLMALAVGWLAAGLLAAAAAFYIFVYTIWLKRRTAWNIVIGGAAGAFPPLIGWTAVTGRVDWPAVILFLIVFFWTPPHFWALSLYRNDDYRRAGVPILPLTAGVRRTKLEMLAYTVVLLPLSMAPAFAGIAGSFYLAGVTVLGGGFILCALRVLEDEGHRAARQMFAYSILYLTLLFALLLVERLTGGGGP